MIRRILAVAAGFAAWTLLWLGANKALTVAIPDIFHEDGSVGSTGILLLVVVLSVLFSVAAGFITASLAGRRGMKPVLVLAGIQVAIGIRVEIAYWDVIPLWYHLAFIGLLAPAIIAGGRIAMGRRRDPVPA